MFHLTGPAKKVFFYQKSESESLALSLSLQHTPAFTFLEGILPASTLFGRDQLNETLSVGMVKVKLMMKAVILMVTQIWPDPLFGKRACEQHREKTSGEKEEEEVECKQNEF